MLYFLSRFEFETIQASIQCSIRCRYMHAYTITYIFNILIDEARRHARSIVRSPWMRIIAPSRLPPRDDGPCDAATVAAQQRSFEFFESLDPGQAFCWTGHAYFMYKCGGGMERAPAAPTTTPGPTWRWAPATQPPQESSSRSGAPGARRTAAPSRTTTGRRPCGPTMSC